MYASAIEPRRVQQQAAEQRRGAGPQPNSLRRSAQGNSSPASPARARTRTCRRLQGMDAPPSVAPGSRRGVQRPIPPPTAPGQTPPERVAAGSPARPLPSTTSGGPAVAKISVPSVPRRCRLAERPGPIRRRPAAAAEVHGAGERKDPDRWETRNRPTRRIAASEPNTAMNDACAQRDRPARAQTESSGRGQRQQRRGGRQRPKPAPEASINFMATAWSAAPIVPGETPPARDKDSPRARAGLPDGGERRAACDLPPAWRKFIMCPRPIRTSVPGGQDDNHLLLYDATWPERGGMLLFEGGNHCHQNIYTAMLEAARTPMQSWNRAGARAEVQRVLGLAAGRGPRPCAPGSSSGGLTARRFPPPSSRPRRLANSG